MNLLTIVILILLVVKMIEGYKRGMVKEIISFVSLIVLCGVVVLISRGMQSYIEKEFLGVAAAVLLLCILGIVHHLLGVLFFSAKMLSRLPIVHWVDKLLGIAVGGLEVVLILWTIYILIMNFGLGMIGQQILTYTQESEILSWLYRYNFLAKWISGLNLEFPPIQL